MEQLREFVSSLLSKARVPGFAIAVVKNDEPVLVEGFGKRDVEAQLPVTPDTLFAIASCTKAFTAIALGILVDQGKLTWDQPVREILPGFRMHDLFATERLTVRDLLAHRSGLPRHDLVWYGSPITREAIVQRLRYLEPSRDLRTAWQYQNLMYTTAGYLTGIVAGCSWEEFVRREIMNPLGMARSTFSVTDSQRDENFAQPYRELDGAVDRVPFCNLDAVAPTGGINSSVQELINWLRFQLGDGTFQGRTIVSEPTLRETQTPQMLMPDPLKHDELGYRSYGLGWWISSYRGRLFVQHSGGIDGFSSLTTLLPREKVGMVTLSNRSGNVLTHAATFRALDLLLGLEPAEWFERLSAEQAELQSASKQGRQQAAAQRISGTRPAHPLDDLVDAYEHPGYGTLRITRAGEQLRAQINGFDLMLEHVHYDQFEGYHEIFQQTVKMVFNTDLAGRVTSASAQLEEGVPAIVFMRAPVLIARAELEKLAGTYDMTAIQATVTLRDDNVLVFAMPGKAPVELEPVDVHLFTMRGMPGQTIAFTRDAHGAVVSALVTFVSGALTAARVA